MISRFARDEWWLDRAGAREAYLELLGRATTRTDAQVLAYCLMSNHVHVVVVQGDEPLSRLTKSVHTGFAGWAQRVRRRRARGPVFAGRPRMLLLDSDEYLLELVRYVHNNPVRAKVARFARSSGWSSHQAYIGRVEAPEWLRLGYVLERFGGSRRRAVAGFDAFVDAGRKGPRRPELSGARDTGEAAAVRRALGDGHRVSDGVVGGDAFVERVRADRERVQMALSSRGQERRPGPIGRPALRDVLDAVLRYLELDAIELEQRPRARKSAEVKRLTTWMWVHHYGGRQVEVARELALDTSVVSRYYSQAVEDAGEYDERATAVQALLKRKRKRGRKRARTAASDGGVPVRYHVDVVDT